MLNMEILCNEGALKNIYEQKSTRASITRLILQQRFGLALVNTFSATTTKAKPVRSPRPAAPSNIYSKMGIWRPPSMATTKWSTNIFLARWLMKSSTPTTIVIGATVKQKKMFAHTIATSKIHRRITEMLNAFSSYRLCATKSSNFTQNLSSVGVCTGNPGLLSWKILRPFAGTLAITFWVVSSA